jgi:hypothetical protein
MMHFRQRRHECVPRSAFNNFDSKTPGRQEMPTRRVQLITQR